MISVILSSLKKYCPLDKLLVYLWFFLLRLHNFQQLKNFIRNSIIKYFAGTLAALKLIQKWLLIIIANVSCCAKVERKLRRWNLTPWVNWFFLLHFAAAAIASVIFPPRTGAALCGCMLHTGDKRLLQYKVCTYIVLIISNFWCNPRALNDWEILRSTKNKYTNEYKPIRNGRSTASFAVTDSVSFRGHRVQGFTLYCEFLMQNSNSEETHWTEVALHSQ